MGQTMSNTDTCSDKEHGDSSGQPGSNDNNVDSSYAAVQITADIVIGDVDEASQDGGPTLAPVLGEKETQKDMQTYQSPTVEHENRVECDDAATNAYPVLDKTLDTTTSVDASDEEACGSLASLNEEKAWDPFGLSSKDDDAEDIVKSIRMLRRKCLVLIICIGPIALVGGLASLARASAARRPVSLSVEKEDLSSRADYPKGLAKAEAPSSTPTSFPPSLVPTSGLVVENYVSSTTSPATGVPTDTPTYAPTYSPSLTPSHFPSISKDTDKPTITTDPPSPKPTPSEPSNGPSSDLPTAKDIELPQYDTFSFYVTGDAPYSPAEEELVREQLAEISELVTEEDMFLFHVGDLMRAKTTFCQRSSYQFIEDAFTQMLPNLPVFLIPGDNDWNDCPDPDLAWQYWEAHFMAFEQNYMGVRSYLPFVKRQSQRQENLSFVLNGVLVLGLNHVGGVDDSSYEQRLTDNEDWIDEQVIKYEDDLANGRIRLCVIFIHSSKGSRVFRHIKRALSAYSFPTLFFKGDGHTFEVAQNLRDVGQDFGWTLFQAVQVDQGGKAPPIKITVQGTTAEALATPFDVDTSDNSNIFWDFVRLDRRGGVYSNFVENGGIDDE